MTATANSWIGDLVQQHLDAAYNLSRWLLGNEQDAADAVHDAYVRAARAAHTYAGGNARSWWLAIVRNCCLTNLATRKRETHLRSVEATLEPSAPRDAESGVHADQCKSLIADHLRALPAEFREALVLRELEDLSYREIADVLDVPIGTVMSRLSRGRAMLQRALADAGDGAQEKPHGL
ncbi:MAG TPA: sigma-70 family RNA polymerase sigma factor [Rudaea sp.]|jgi:RNA polymerase sigma-70 factor (ECF subfamily)|nr:sigma-70 family RNA polymerase sigma factor [Rudaea sp.]